MHWSSLRVKFSLAIVFLIIAMMTVLGISLTRRIQDPIREAVLKKGEALLGNLAANAREGLLTDDELMVGQLLDQMKKDPSVIEAAILDYQRRVIAHSDRSVKKGDLWKAPTPSDAVAVLRQLIEVKGKSIGEAVLLMSQQDVEEAIAHTRKTIVNVAAVLLVVGVMASLVLVRYITRPLKALTRGVEMVGSGNLEHRIAVGSSDEIGELAHAFNAMTTRLQRAQEDLLEQDRLRQELRIAKEIQDSLLPKEFPKIEGIEVAAFYQSAKEVGGDYYDFFWVDQRRLGIVIADVSGKGVPGALGMTVTRNILRSKAVGKSWPSQVLSQTNTMLRDNLKRGMFVTMFYTLLDIREKTLTCANAGHHPLLVFRKGTGLEVVDPPGMALALGEGREFERTLSDITVQLYGGDICVLYSDGVSEALNDRGEEYGERRFIDTIERVKTLPLEDMLKSVKDDLTAFTGEQSQHDDMTIVALKIG